MVWILLLLVILLYPTLIINILIWITLNRVVMSKVFYPVDVLSGAMVEHRKVIKEALVDVRGVACDCIDARYNLSLRLVR